LESHGKNYNVGIVFPNEAITRRWNGALQARLRRVPLEAFLRARGIDPAPAGVAQDTDNLVRATVSIVEAGLAIFFEDRQEGLAASQQAIVGHVTCLVSRSAAQLILQPEAWRTVALVSIARVLTPWIGLNSAALASASYTRLFQRALPKDPSAMDARVSQSALCAVTQGSTDAMAEVSTTIALYLSCTDVQDWSSYQEAVGETAVES
jgi:hypothetical protein